MSWLLLAGVGQPLAMELYRWAPWLTDAPILARLFVRLISLAGPAAIIAALSIVPVEDAARWFHRVRKYAWPTAMLLLLGAVHAGMERNAVYRVAFLALQILLAATWWCAIKGESRANRRVAHYARLAGFLWACLGVLLCIAAQFVLAWDTMGGTVPEYDPWQDDPSQAGALGVHWATWALVSASLLSIPALMWINGHWRRLQAKLMRIGR